MQHEMNAFKTTTSWKWRTKTKTTTTTIKRELFTCVVILCYIFVIITDHVQFYGHDMNLYRFTRGSIP